MKYRNSFLMICVMLWTSQMHSMLVTKQCYKLSCVKKNSRPFFTELAVGALFGIGASVAVFDLIYIPNQNNTHANKHDKNLYNEIVTLGSKNCSNAFIKKERCENDFCCKDLDQFSCDYFAEKEAYRKKLKIFNEIHDKHHFLIDIKVSLKELENKARNAQAVLVYDEMNINEYNAIMDLIKHKQECYYKAISLFEEYKEDYYEQQKILYTEKLQKKQQELRELAALYELQWLTKKDDMEELMKQLCTMKNKKNDRDQASELHLYDRSLSLMKPKENLQNKE